MSEQDMAEELARLKAENEKLKAGQNKTRDITFKVSQKGAVSVYGMGRFPVTLYKEQWHRLLERKDELLQFIEENNDSLATKN